MPKWPGKRVPWMDADVEFPGRVVSQRRKATKTPSPLYFKSAKFVKSADQFFRVLYKGDHPPRQKIFAAHKEIERL